VGAVAHPDLVHPNMRGRRHVTRLARQQQEYAHRLAIGVARDTGTFALRRAREHADADGGEHVEIAEASAKRNGIVDRAAARIQYQGCAAKIPAALKLLEFLRTV